MTWHTVWTQRGEFTTPDDSNQVASIRCHVIGKVWSLEVEDESPEDGYESIFLNRDHMRALRDAINAELGETPCGTPHGDRPCPNDAH